MAKNIPLLIALSTTTLAAACEMMPKMEEAQYWQRTSASETVYMRGQKAQQMLNRDISHCVTELRELERLGQLRGTIPTNSFGRVLDPDEQKLADYDMPERDGALWAEHSDYHDFESCMTYKGWERTTSIPYDVAERAEKTYKKNHRLYQYKTKYEKQNRNNGNFNDLNE